MNPEKGRPTPENLETIEVKGRDLVSGIPKILAIDSEEVRVAISEQIDAIVETVRIALEQTPPELAADIVDSGIVLTGGGALLKNLDKYFYSTKPCLVILFLHYAHVDE